MADSKVRKYCATHKKPKMVDVSKRHCQAEGCVNWPSFGVQGQRRGVRCAVHARKEDVDLQHQKCRTPGCTKTAAFGNEGDRCRIACSGHKEAGHVDLVNRCNRCQVEGCQRPAGYGLLGGKRERCVKHKQDMMIDLKVARCRRKGCTSRALYSFIGSNKRVLCDEHKEDGMSKPRHCQTKGCHRLATCVAGDNPERLRCGAHKEEGMVEMGQDADLQLLLQPRLNANAADDMTHGDTVAGGMTHIQTDLDVMMHAEIEAGAGQGSQSYAPTPVRG